MRNCEKCNKPADVYAMGRYSGDWGGRYCDAHIPAGFIVTDKYDRNKGGTNGQDR